MMERAEHKKVTWVDLENPTQEEARQLIEEFNIAPIVADELLSPTLRPKVDVHDEFIYLILHFPTAYSTQGADDTKKTQEVDFIIGKNFIITTHYDTIDALHEFSKVFEVSSILDKSNMGEHAGYVFYYMVQQFYRQMMNRVENVRDAMCEAENNIFEGKEKEMVVELSRLNRILLSFKESLFAHREVLQSFEIAGERFFDDAFKYHLRGIVGEYYKVASSIDSAKEYLNELRLTNDSLLSSKQNEIMKKLTVMAFLVLPLSLLAGIFGMNARHMPFVGQPNDFVIILGVMFAVTLVIFAYFKGRKWL